MRIGWDGMGVSVEANGDWVGWEVVLGLTKMRQDGNLFWGSEKWVGWGYCLRTYKRETIAREEACLPLQQLT